MQMQPAPPRPKADEKSPDDPARQCRKRGERRSGPHEGSIESPQLKETPNYQPTGEEGGGRGTGEGPGNIGKRFDLATAAAGSAVAPPAFIPPRQIYFSAQWRAICIAAGIALAFPTLTSL